MTEITTCSFKNVMTLHTKYSDLNLVRRKFPSWNTWWHCTSAIAISLRSETSVKKLEYPNWGKFQVTTDTADDSKITQWETWFSPRERIARKSYETQKAAHPFPPSAFCIRRTDWTVWHDWAVCRLQIAAIAKGSMAQGYISHTHTETRIISHHHERQDDARFLAAERRKEIRLDLGERQLRQRIITGRSRPRGSPPAHLIWIFIPLPPPWPETAMTPPCHWETTPLGLRHCGKSERCVNEVFNICKDAVLRIASNVYEASVSIARARYPGPDVYIVVKDKRRESSCTARAGPAFSAGCRLWKRQSRSRSCTAAGINANSDPSVSFTRDENTPPRAGGREGKRFSGTTKPLWGKFYPSDEKSLGRIIFGCDDSSLSLFLFLTFSLLLGFVWFSFTSHRLIILIDAPICFHCISLFGTLEYPRSLNHADHVTSALAITCKEDLFAHTTRAQQSLFFLF